MRDQRLVGVARALLEDRLARRPARLPVDVRAALVDDDVHRVRVVGDRHVATPISVGVVPEPASVCPGFCTPVFGYVLAPGDRRRARRGGVEPVQRLVGDDEDAAGLVDRERVADRLARGRSLRTAPLAGSTVPTTPFCEANQIRPYQSGSAEMIASPAGTAPLRS